MVTPGFSKKKIAGETIWNRVSRVTHQITFRRARGWTHWSATIRQTEGSSPLVGPRGKTALESNLALSHQCTQLSIILRARVVVSIFWMIYLNTAMFFLQNPLRALCPVKSDWVAYDSPDQIRNMEETRIPHTSEPIRY